MTHGKKLVVYFGCMFSIATSQKESQDQQKPEQESQAEIFSDKDKEEVILERTKMIEGLNKSGEVHDVSDLFVDLPPERLYNPIFFRVHLPLSLQKPDYVYSKSSNALVEDFECVYSGDVLFISALCDTDKEPFGVFDVRDRIIRIFEKIMKIEVIPPCLFARPVVFAIKGEIAPSKKHFALFEIPEVTESKVLMGKLNLSVGYELGAFYEVSSLAKDVGKLVGKIQKKTSNLLKSMIQPSGKTWKRRLGIGISEIRRGIVDILADVTKCQYYNNLRKRKMRDFQMFWNRTEIIQVLSPDDLRFYGEPYQEVDAESILKSLELVRSELDSYTRNRITILSALAGGVIGSIVTLILSQILALG